MFQDVFIVPLVLSLVKIKVHAHIVLVDIIKTAIVKVLALNVQLELIPRKKDQRMFNLAFLSVVMDLIHQLVLYLVSNVQETLTPLNHQLEDSKIAKHVPQTLTHSNLLHQENTSVAQSVHLEVTHQLA
jgi:hypothetical protein